MNDHPTVLRRPRGIRGGIRLAGRTIAGTAAILTALLIGASPAWGEGQDGADDLQQVIPPGLEVATGPAVLDHGHTDLGPRFIDGKWTLMIHDDQARADANAVSVWRHPVETVLWVVDAAMLSVPDDPAYAFLGAEPGSPVWVVPQTQNPDAVWLGWNTQDAEVMERIDRGMTLSLIGVEGPGTVTAYLQSGTFGEPEVLWDSRNPDVQPLWVDVNTHTHANWVFTEPGTYLIALRADADLVDGTSVSDTQYVRFTVGSDTSVDDAFAAAWTRGTSTPAPADEEDGDGANPVEVTDATDPLVPILLIAIVVTAGALLAGLIVVIARGRSAKRRALDARAASETRVVGVDHR
jgi:surface-anchored protein